MTPKASKQNSIHSNPFSNLGARIVKSGNFFLISHKSQSQYKNTFPIEADCHFRQVQNPIFVFSGPSIKLLLDIKGSPLIVNKHIEFNSYPTESMLLNLMILSKFKAGHER